MKQKLFLCVSTMFLIMALAACSAKEPDANLLSVSKNFEIDQNAMTAVDAADTPVVTEADGIVVTTEEANIRSGPGTDYDILDKVEGGVELERTGIAGEWVRVIYDGQTAYVYNSLVALREEYTVEAASGTVTAAYDVVNIRSGAGTTYPILYAATTGNEYALTGVTDTGWYEIDYEGQKGYIRSDLVDAVLDDAESTE